MIGHEHANIHKALKYAVKMDLIPFNPADKVERPKKQKYIADYYRLDELKKLFEVTKDHGRAAGRSATSCCQRKRALAMLDLLQQSVVRIPSLSAKIKRGLLPLFIFGGDGGIRTLVAVTPN